MTESLRSFLHCICIVKKFPLVSMKMKYLKIKNKIFFNYTLSHKVKVKSTIVEGDPGASGGVMVSKLD